MKPLRLLAALALLGLLACEPVGDPGASADTRLTMFAPTRTITATLYSNKGVPVVDVKPAFFIEALNSAFEVQVTRPAYDRPIQARAFLGHTWRTLPISLLDEWDGFKHAFALTWRDSTGAVIKTANQDWCPNRGPLKRIAASSPPASRYATLCGAHPFNKGQRWGIEGGWAVQGLGGTVDPPALVAGQTYSLDVHLRTAVGNFLGIKVAERDITFTVNAVQGTDKTLAAMHADGSDPSAAPGPVTSTATRAASKVPPEPHGTNMGYVLPSNLPDLVALPVVGLGVVREAGLDQLEFSSTIWNAGGGPLVIDGYRRGSSYRANGHQLFFNRAGQRVGDADVSEMLYDKRQTHLHWHLMDFGQYDLIDSAGRQVAKTPTKGFCIAPTDPIDLLLKTAPANPGNGNLATACGDVKSVYVREVLVPGWGDTYTQRHAGNSIDITDVPNGTYRVRVIANTDGAIHETTRSNNVSLRTITLGGTPGHRTWVVPPYQSVDSEARFGAISPEGPGASGY